MTATYSGDPSTSNTDAVRFLVGDTGPVNFEMQDEELAYLLTINSSPLSAAAAAADALCARFASQVDELTGDIQRKCSQRAEAYGKLAEKLRTQSQSPLTTNPIPFAGGTSLDDLENSKRDRDRYPDIFGIGISDDEDSNFPHSNCIDYDKNNRRRY